MDLTSEFTGAEVACRGISVLFDELERSGRSPEVLLSGVHYPLEHLLSENQRIDWESYRTLMANAGRIWPDEELVRIGAGFLHSRWANPLVVIARFFYSVTDLYMWLAEPQTGGATLYFTSVRYEARKTDRDRLEFSYTMREGYEPCRELQFMMKGLLVQLPTIAGLEPAVVELEPAPNGARYEVRVPPGHTLARVRGLLTLPFRLGRTIRELRNAHEILHVRFRELEAHIARCKSTEDALRAQEERYRTLAEKAHDSIIEINTEGRFYYASPNFGSAIGYEPGELTGQSGFDLVHPDDRERVMQDFAILLRTGVSQKPIYRVMRRGGGWVWIESTSTVYKTASGESRVVVVSRDVTERKQVEEELRVANERMRTLMANAPIALVAVDRNGVVTVCEGRGFETAGIKPSDLVGRSLLQVYRESPGVRVHGRLPIEEYLQRALAGEDFSITMEVEDHALETRHTPIRDETGEVVGLIGVATDITQRVQAEAERKRLESEVQQAQKLESLGVLAGGIAHDFNNLLTSILGHAELALSDLDEGSPARANIERIRDAGRHATDLTRQLLAYAGRTHVRIEPLNLSALVESMADLLKVSISKKAVLSCEPAADLPAIDADAAQITQVVLTLITNASEALGEEAGRITLRTGAVELQPQEISRTYASEKLPEGPYVYLEVEDTGVGMDEETQSKIFDPFFTTKFPGRGVGLAAVRGIIRIHGGAIHVESQPGQGTTFRVLLPRREQAEPVPVEPRPSEGGSSAGGTVLVVDDEEGVRDVTEAILPRLGFEVLTAADGPTALELLRAHRDEIVAVLLDMTMPEMDGEEVFRELKRIQPDLLILVMSGYAEREAMSRFAGSGYAGFLQKPFSMEVLERTLRDALAQEGPE
jgi:PAS domain S-box-containing protein